MASMSKPAPNQCGDEPDVALKRGSYQYRIFCSLVAEHQGEHMHYIDGDAYLSWGWVSSEQPVNPDQGYWTPAV